MFDKPQPLQADQLDRELHVIRKATFNSMLPMDEYVRDAVAFLDQDIADPALEEAAKDDPQIFVWRANQMGVALVEREAYRHAVRVYGALLRRAEEFVTSTGKQRDLRALKANFGFIMVLNRDFDAGVSLILESAPEIDVALYRKNPRDAYALNSLRDGIEKDAVSHYIELCDTQFRTATGHPLALDAVLTMANHLNPLGEVTLVSLVPLMQHVEWHKRASTPFGRVRIMDGLRWLSSMLENMARSIGVNSVIPQVQQAFRNDPKITLWPAYQNLFAGRSWWSTAVQVLPNGTAEILNTDSDADILAKYQTLFAMPENNREELFTKIVLLSRLTRNLSMHYLELPALVIDQIVRQIIQYQLLAQLLIFDWGFREGHFAQLADPGVWPR
jgi:hypothetical protein